MTILSNNIIEYSTQYHIISTILFSELRKISHLEKLYTYHNILFPINQRKQTQNLRV